MSKEHEVGNVEPIEATINKERGKTNFEIIFDASNIAFNNTIYPEGHPNFRNLLIALNYYRNKKILILPDASLLSYFQNKGSTADADAFRDYLNNDEFVKEAPNNEIEAYQKILKIALEYPCSKIVTNNKFEELLETPPRTIPLEKIQKSLHYLSQDELLRIRSEILDRKERIINFNIVNDIFMPFE
jgi:hypothetical protein